MQLLLLRIQKRKLSWAAFWRRHVYLVRSTAQMVQNQDLHRNPQTTARSPWRYMFKTTAFVTTFLTVAGGSWYVAVDMTSPSDLTAIYNCSAFFAYVFSIMLLHDKLRLDKMLSVALAILGVLIVAYGDKEAPKSPTLQKKVHRTAPSATSSSASAASCTGYTKSSTNASHAPPKAAAPVEA
jgi:drug/metabolite transporter (DMT)-like permease